jgi:uncharacterized protein YdaU (DUF1376 family)
LNFYKHHIGDYDADTAHLSWVEDAAYRRLISLYYRREGPIPAEISQACRLVRATSKQEREAVETVLREFFVESPDGWRSKRCDEEIESARTKAKANQENGKGGGRPKKKPIAPAKANPDETDDKTESKPTGLIVGSDTRAGPTATSQTPDSSSEAKASAAAPPAADPMSAKDRLWAIGVALLGEKGRSHIGKLLSTYGEAVLLDALSEATREQPGDPKSWLVAACEARGKAKPAKANGHHHQEQTTMDLLNRDPHAEWATKAGFKNIFEAESAGCGEGNAHKFRDGKRTEPA